MPTAFKPENMPSLIPYLTVSDAAQALIFYHEAFQFEILGEPKKHDDQIVHAQMRLGDALIMFAPEGAWGSDRLSPAHSNTPCPMQLYIYVKDVDKHFEQATQQGAQAIDPPEDTFWGDRMSRLQDPFGYVWAFATHQKDPDPKASSFQAQS